MKTTIDSTYQLLCKSYKDGDLVVCLEAVNTCFETNPKATLRRIYDSKHLKDLSFLQIAIRSNYIPQSYKNLFLMIIGNEKGISAASEFLKNYSKLQILQGVANFLEKRNAELKYNQHWKVKYCNANNRHLETERQSVYFTSVGISFQAILARFYLLATDKEQGEKNCNQNAENLFEILFKNLVISNKIFDTIEKHLFFDWSLDSVSQNIVNSSVSNNFREGKPAVEVINSLKRKLRAEEVEAPAVENCLKMYQSENDLAINVKRFFEYYSTVKSEDELKWLDKAFMCDIAADTTIEKDLLLFEKVYFPGLKDNTKIRLANGQYILLRATFRVLRFLSEMSIKHIESIDSEYANAVNQYSINNPSVSDLNKMELEFFFFKRDKHKIKEVLNEYYDDNIFAEQQNIIHYAKESISFENCLIRYDFESLVNTINLLHGFDKEFIKSTIAMFVFYDPAKDDVARKPFFILGTEICWMPNTVAYVSFTENLLENLLSENKISIHGIQKNMFEGNLNNLFREYGYKVIEAESNRIYRDFKGNDVGDFDVLAFKNGTLIYIEVKLTNARNSYCDRIKWRNKKLVEADKQLEKGLLYIKEHPDHIRGILGLEEHENIERLTTFIGSNSFLFDHEIIEKHVKVSYEELMATLILTEHEFPMEKDNAESFVLRINNNWLFSGLENLPLVRNDSTIKVDDIKLISEGIVLQNIFT